MPTSIDSVMQSGISRRGFFRFAAGASALATMPIFTEPQMALAQRVKLGDPNKGIHIDANENPLGPSEAARKAVADIIPRGGRYLLNMQEELVAAFAEQEGLKPEQVMVFPGSSEPLQYTVLAFSDASHPVVVADPGYEAPIWAAETSKASVIKVPLADPRGAAAHDIKAMLAAATSPGVIYICNPNNPTGTLTSRSDIEYAVANAPKGTILLIDEAYIHLAGIPSAIDFVKEGKDVIVLRTFSKLYGMAGLRLGLVIARPDLLSKIGALGGFVALPITAVAAGQVSLADADLVPARRRIIGDIRNETFDWLKANGYSFTPAQSNCFMLETNRPGKHVIAAMAAKEIYIGRIWPAWPTHVRITVGTHEEMLAFRSAFKEVMAQPATAWSSEPVLPNPRRGYRTLG